MKKYKTNSSLIININKLINYYSFGPENISLKLPISQCMLFIYFDCRRCKKCFFISTYIHVMNFRYIYYNSCAKCGKNQSKKQKK